jgi:putative chitinase
MNASNIIKQYQLDNNLLADGIIGKKTLQHLKAKLNIPTNEALAHFIGQIAHESGNFTSTTENLNYSTAGLLATFGKYFKSTAETVGYARNPEKIANKVYANRYGNGPESSGDGYKFRGRSGLQLTFKANYEAFGASIGVDLVQNPDLVADKYFFEAGKWFFDTKNIWELTSKVNNDSIKAVSKVVNGGYNGLADRIEQTLKYYKIQTDK